MLSQTRRVHVARTILAWDTRVCKYAHDITLKDATFTANLSVRTAHPSSQVGIYRHRNEPLMQCTCAARGSSMQRS